MRERTRHRLLRALLETANDMRRLGILSEEDLAKIARRARRRSRGGEGR
jgi:hypothetical protein